MKDTTKVWLSSNLSWLFGIGTYLILSNDELVLQVPTFIVVLLGGTTIVTFVFGFFGTFDFDEEDSEDSEDSEDNEDSSNEKLESCIGFQYYPEDDYE